MIYLCENILDFPFEEALRRVSAERREQVMRYRFEIDRRQSLAAYRLLQYGLKQEYGLEGPPSFAYLPGDKPLLRDYPTIHFNLSHCRQGVACAISRYPIGVDIEAIASIDQAVAQRVMSADQLAQIASSPHPERTFCELWTTKESLLKQTGEGLCEDLPGLALDRFTFTHYQGEKYCCTACYSSPDQHEEFILVRL